MSEEFHTSLTYDKCVSRLSESLADSRQFSGVVEGTSFRLDMRRKFSLMASNVPPLDAPALSGEFIPQEPGTLVQYTLGDADSSSRPVEWKRLLKLLLPLLAGAALLLLLFDITSPRDWFLALVFPALLIAVIVARQVFATLQARAAQRELVEFLHRVIGAKHLPSD